MSLPGKFEVNATGAATYTVPIAVPPGTAGMTPSLTLEYNSQGGNGILGLGWSLGGLPSIGRCAQTIAQDGARGAVTYTDNDRFCMEGQRLVAINGGGYGQDGTEYRTEIDSYSRIISHGRNGNGPSWFEVHTKSGQIMHFGNTSAQTGNAQAFVQCTSTVRSWALNRVWDTRSNYYTISYYNDSVTCGGGGQVVPQEIDYTGTATNAPYNKVLFLYQWSRPDNLLAFEAGAQQQTSALLTNIQTFNGNSIVSNYQMAYSQTPSTARSILTSITACGNDGLCLPATTFTWNTGSDGFQPGNPVVWQTSGAGNNVSFTTGDIDGDGKSDIVAYNLQNGVLQVYAALSNGSGSFGASALTTLGGFWPSGYSSLNILMGDVNGDGRADVILVVLNMTGFQIYVALSNGNGGFGNLIGWDSGALGGWGTGAYIDPNNGGSVFLWNATAVDINGDGRADVVVYYGGQTYTALSTGNGFGAAVASTISGLFPGMWLVDINGDGRADVVSPAATTNGLWVAAALSNGDGTYRATQYSQVGGNYNQWGAATGDVNGDGRSDVVAYFLGSGGIQAVVALSRGDGTFAFQPMWNRAVGDLRGYSLSVADINGDGRGDLIAYKFTQTALSMGAALSQSNGQFEDPIYFPTAEANTTGWQLATADIDGDGRTDLIAYAFTPNSTFTAVTARAPSQAMAVSSITTAVGLVTNLMYLPLTASNSGVYWRDSGSQYPLQDLQGPLYVTGMSSTSNGVGAFYNVYYNYLGAKLDLSGRGFLGFRQHNIWDAQTNIYQSINYHQDFPYIGMIDSESRWFNSQMLNRTTNSYGAIGLGGPRWQVFLSQTKEESSDFDGTVMPPVQTSYQYDAYNNPLQVTVQTMQPGTSTPDGYSKTTTSTYTNDTTSWLLGRLTGATVTSTTP